MVLRQLSPPAAQPCNPDQGICFDESGGEMQKLRLDETGRAWQGVIKSSMIQRPPAIHFKHLQTTVQIYMLQCAPSFLFGLAPQEVVARACCA